MAKAASLRDSAPPVRMCVFTRMDDAQDGVTPLFMASSYGHEGCAKLLLEAKATIDAVNKVNGSFDATRDVIFDIQTLLNSSSSCQ